MFYHTAKFLRGTGQKPRHVHQGQNGNFKRITKPHKARSFARTVNIKTARQNHRLICHNADGLALKAYKTGYDITRKLFLNFKKVTLVSQF